MKICPYIVCFWVIQFHVEVAESVQCLSCITELFNLNKEDNLALILVEEKNDVTLLWREPTGKERNEQFLFACPLDDDSEIKKKKKNAATNTSLFFKTIEDINEIQLCKNPVVPAVLMRKEEHYSFGFEIYTGGKKTCSTSKWEMGLKKDFCWFFVMDIRYTLQLNPQYVFYVLGGRGDQNEPINTNQKINLGKELIFKNLDVEPFYSIDNQTKVFTKAFENVEERLKYFDPANNKNLEKLFLAEPDNFYFKDLKKVAFTYANIVPVWSSIKNGAWNRLNKLLLSTLRDEDQFSIATGTYGTLKLPNKIFLAGEDKLPVPLVLWKYIQFIYILENDNVVEHTSFHEIIILIHNDPYDKNPELLCPNVCGKYDWDEIENDKPEYGFTYCCKVNREIIDLLGVKNSLKKVPDSFTRYTFNLHYYRIDKLLSYVEMEPSINIASSEEILAY